MNALCDYVRTQNDSSNDTDPQELLTTLCSRSKEDLPQELLGAWPKIAESLQDRSVQSIHNLCRRKFNPNNYHGNWTKDEEKILQDIVAIHGKSWKVVAEKLVE